MSYGRQIWITVREWILVLGVLMICSFPLWGIWNYVVPTFGVPKLEVMQVWASLVFVFILKKIFFRMDLEF